MERIKKKKSKTCSGQRRRFGSLTFFMATREKERRGRKTLRSSAQLSSSSATRTETPVKEERETNDRKEKTRDCLKKMQSFKKKMQQYASTPSMLKVFLFLLRSDACLRKPDRVHDTCLLKRRKRGVAQGNKGRSESRSEVEDRKTSLSSLGCWDAA